jgi:uncharacterized protein (DUF3084 family)
MKRKTGIILTVFGALVMAQAEDLDLTKETLSKWVETRKLISEEKNKWVLEREILGDRIDLVRSEKETLAEKITETRSKITDADKKRQALVKENDELKNASATLVNRIYTLERQVLALLPTLPQPIQDQIKPLSQQIPKTEETDLSLSQRYQNIIGIINNLNKNAGEIRVMSEVKKLSDGTTAEVQTMYIGYAQAYYCNNAGDIAGYGYPTSEGWEWEEDNTLATKVSEAIAVLKNEQVAKFIPLPAAVN